MPLNSFAKRNCIIGKPNARTEEHGDETVPAADIQLSGIPFDRDDVDQLCGKYYSRSLFNEEGRGAGKVFNPALDRFSAFVLKDIFYKSRAVITFNFNDTKIDLKKIRIKGVTLEPQAGGTTMVSLKLQGRPTQEEMGLLYGYQGKQESVTLYFGTTVDDEQKPKADDKQASLALGEGGAKSYEVEDGDEDEDDDKSNGKRGSREGTIGDQPAH